jgi:hypothetical protein
MRARVPSLGRPLGLAGVLLLIAALLAALAPAISSSAATREPGPASCAAGIDPYRLPEGALAHCGVTYYPLLRTYPLPDGGTAYAYRAQGALITYYVPRAGFNPYLASPAVRSAYDIPSMPAAGPGRQRWILMSRHPWYVTPGPFIVSAPAAPTLNKTSGNYAGYVTFSKHQRYSTVGSLWTEPHFLPSVCKAVNSAFWVGLGGIFKNEDLAQDGTTFGLPGFGLHQAFWEILPAKPMPVRGLYATPGQGFDAETEHVRSTKFATEYRFRMANLAVHGKSANFTETVSGGWSGKHADVIVEWPFTTGLAFANFGHINFFSAGVNGKELGSLPHYAENMVDGHPLATTSRLTGGSNFTVTHNHCM